jgi:hypothetical protein
VEHRKAYAYSRNLVVWPAGNLPEQPELSTTMPGRLSVAESTVVQVLFIDTFTHSGFYPAVYELSPSTVVSVEY